MWQQNHSLVSTQIVFGILLHFHSSLRCLHYALSRLCFSFGPFQSPFTSQGYEVLTDELTIFSKCSIRFKIQGHQINHERPSGVTLYGQKFVNPEITPICVSFKTFTAKLEAHNHTECLWVPLSEHLSSNQISGLELIAL